MGKNILSHDLVFSSFRLQKNGLTPQGKPTFEEWVHCGLFIQEAEQSVQFWIGDWLKPRDILRRFWLSPFFDAPCRHEVDVIQ
jgi:hypothetical protein